MDEALFGLSMVAAVIMIFLSIPIGMIVLIIGIILTIGSLILLCLAEEKGLLVFALIAGIILTIIGACIKDARVIDFFEWFF